MKITEQGQQEVASYIGELSAELAKMAQNAHCDWLSHCLAMAAFEASRLNHTQGGRKKRPRPRGRSRKAG
jgi:hypothetical protein